MTIALLRLGAAALIAMGCIMSLCGSYRLLEARSWRQVANGAGYTAGAMVAFALATLALV